MMIRKSVSGYKFWVSLGHNLYEKLSKHKNTTSNVCSELNFNILSLNKIDTSSFGIRFPHIFKC